MENWLEWGAGLLGLANTIWLLYAAWKRFKPELKKMESQADFDVLEGARQSQQMLIDRINDLEEQINQERESRKAELEQERNNWKSALEAEKDARKRDNDYLRRKFKDADREARDYRQWAAKLVKQVVEAGKVPAPFIPSPEESEVGISAIKSEQEKKDDIK